MDTSEPKSPLPQLPVNLDDPVAVETWCGTWNAWIAAESGRQNWPWLKPISPETLREIVDGEKQLRVDMARGRQHIELTMARSDLNALEAHLRATDPQYETKRALLVPIVQPIFRHIPPSNWRALFEQAYVQLQVPPGGSTPEEQELTKARTALNDLEGRLKAQDPAYESKKALLVPILKPLFRQLSPSQWTTAFEQAYAGARLPAENKVSQQSTPAAKVAATEPRGSQERVKSFAKVTWWLQRGVWWLQKKWDKIRKPTDEQAEALQGYYTKSINIFRTLEIDVNSKPVDERRLYHMMLLYLDEKEIVCPAAVRTASLIGFLDSLGTGWALPPASVAVSKEFSKDLDGYVAMEVFRNHLGLKDIRDEIVNAINLRSAQLQGRA